jgi:uncharacterized protein YndB with AHSA1/START domain
MEHGIVERSIWIAAARERVWRALTEPEDIAGWLLPPALGAQLKRDESGALLVCMGPMEIPIAALEALDSPRQVTTRSLPDQLLALVFTLEEARGGTQVTLALSGFESLPADARADRVAPSSMALEKTLANLGAAVAGAELPFPDGHIAALFGYRRETKQIIAVERSIWIAAPRERVWRAVTDPAEIEHWFSPGTLWHLTALEVGGRMFAPNAETGAEMYTQVIELVDPPQQFITRTAAEPPEIPYMTTYTLREEGKGTRLTITHSGYELDPSDRRWFGMEQNAFGFGMMVENIKAHVEGERLPYPGGF